jgi:putative peptide zinc metalloprotease protein
MSGSFHSQLWYRIRDLKPALKPGLEIALHTYLGRKWFVLRDPAGNSVHRFTPEAYAIIGAMDGQTPLAAIWQAAIQRLGPQAPSQDDVLNLLVQMYQSDLILVDIVPLADELVERMGRKRARKRARFFRNPMSVPLPLGDPDRLLDTLAPLVRGRAGLVWLAGWLVLVVAALITLPTAWPDLARGGVREILALQNLLLMAAVYPPVKLLHELAHGLAVKRHGGECHEIGVMFLVFFPVPYVDASASAAFVDKWARALVGAAGILAEIALAAAALLIWQAAEPGLVRDLAFNVMLIAGISTVLVNGNPLLKFDGYFVLADLIEMPNLAQRANKWWGDLARRRLLAAPNPEARPVTRTEARTFALYAPAAFVYRIVIMLTIAAFVIESYFMVGVILAIWSVTQGLILPMGKLLKVFFTDPRLIEKRPRAAGMGLALAGVLALALFAVPLPLRSVIEGVVWLPDEATLRAGTPGFILTLDAAAGETVASGALVAQLDNDALLAARAAQAARVQAAEQAVRRAVISERTALRAAEEVLADAERRLADMDRRIAGLSLRAGQAGRVSLPAAQDRLAQYVEQGALLGHILPERPERVRAAAPQYLADLMQDRLSGAQLRFVTGQQGRGEILRLAPAATRRLPSRALARDAGGRIAIDPADPEGLRTLDGILELDLSLPSGAAAAPFGTRVLVKLEFGTEPLGYRMGRALRRVFLSHFGTT